VLHQQAPGAARAEAAFADDQVEHRTAEGRGDHEQDPGERHAGRRPAHDHPDRDAGGKQGVKRHRQVYGKAEMVHDSRVIFRSNSSSAGSDRTNGRGNTVTATGIPSQYPPS